MALSPLLSRYDHVILDLDGCVYLGEQVIPGAAEAVGELRAAGKGLAFVTNDSRRMPEEYVRKLWRLGVQASFTEVITVGSALQHVLADRGGRGGAYVIGAEAIFRHVQDAGLRVVNGTDAETGADVVVVAGHDDLHFAELRAATQAVLAGAEMLAAGRDRTFPTDAGVWPGTGAVVAALEYATEQEARIVGKPDPQIFHTALERLGRGRTLVVGDRLDSDVAGAAAAGLDAALVLSGVTGRHALSGAPEPAPVAVAEDLQALVRAA